VSYKISLNEQFEKDFLVDNQLNNKVNNVTTKF